MFPMRAHTRHLSLLRRSLARVRRPASATFFGLLLVGLLAGCGQGGSSGGGPSPQGVISGIVSDDPIAGAAVTILSASGSQLAAGTTDAQGRFSLQVRDADIQQGYELVATGGQMGGQPFTEEMRALYGPTENRSQANVTLITTLVAKLTQTMSGATSLAKRTTALQKLVNLGMFEDREWSQVEPPSVQLAGLRQRVRLMGVARWTADMVADLADDDLSPASMTGFPNAHGGIVALALPDPNNKPSLFAGERLARSLQFSGADSQISYRFELVSGPGGMRISEQGELSYQAPTVATDQEFAFVASVTNTATGKGRVLRGGVKVMAGQEIASGALGAQGGTVADEWDEVAVVVPAGSATEGTRISVLRSRDAEGNVALKIQADPPPAGSVTIHLPDPEVLERNTPGRSASQRDSSLQSAHGLSSSAQNLTTPATRIEDPYPLTHEWDRVTRDFLFGTKRTPEFTHRAGAFSIRSWRDSLLPLQLTLGLRNRGASVLVGAVPKTENVDGKEPVLFIHGYSPRNDLGGGNETWGDFPQRIRDLGYLPFEFRWRTNARFQDVAEDLRRYIDLIAQKTGKKVHIIAHSFGGIVARTYLQGLADASQGSNYERSVASLITIGTPHSGIADRDNTTMHGVVFPGGQDSLAFEVAGQISTHQMGEDDRGFIEAMLFDVLAVNRDPGEIAASLSKTETNKLPDGLPILVLIGLTTERFFNSRVDEGDFLITYRGQRFHPNLSANGISGLLPGSTMFGGLVTERILGTDRDLKPGDSTPDGFGAGYRHNRLVPVVYPGIPFIDALPEVELECSRDTCPHATFQEVKKQLERNRAGQVSPPPSLPLNLQVVDGDTDQPISGARVSLRTNNNNAAVAQEKTTDAQGRVSIEVPFFPSTRYTALLSADNYRANVFDRDFVTGSTQQESSREFGRVALEPNTPGRGDLSGQVIDAVTGLALTGASYELKNATGRVVARGATDSIGRYVTRSLVRGTYLIHLSKEGYLPGEFPFHVRPNQLNPGNANLRRQIRPGQMSIRLEWGENPRDLDSHLVKYDASGNEKYHIFYAHETDPTTGDNLDRDDVDSFGPETTTIGTVDPTARYMFAVHHFSGSGSITTTSNARVVIHHGGTSQTFSAPSTGTGIWWKVFTIINGRVEPCQTSCLFDDEASALRNAASAMGVLRLDMPDWLRDMRRDLRSK